MTRASSHPDRTLVFGWALHMQNRHKSPLPPPPQFPHLLLLPASTALSSDSVQRVVSTNLFLDCLDKRTPVAVAYYSRAQDQSALFFTIKIISIGFYYLSSPDGKGTCRGADVQEVRGGKKRKKKKEEERERRRKKEKTVPQTLLS